MAEYIKRDTAIRAVMAAKWVDGSDGAMAMEIVASPPAADVVPVVRCKDCKHCGFCGKETNLEVMGFYGYCSRGEKMEGCEDNG